MDFINIQDRNNSLRYAAITAGLGVLIMAMTVPIVEFYIFPKLINYKNAAITVQNIQSNRILFSSAIFIHFITIMCDVVVALALYVFFKPVNKNLAILSAMFRLVYTGFNISALLNLIQIVALLKSYDTFHAITTNQVNEFILFHINSFNIQWRFGLVFFGVYLLLVSILIFKSSYVPKAIGMVILIAALGYLIEDLKYFFYPHLDTGFLWFTFFGELIFMGWLLIKGSRIQLKLSN